MEAADPLAPAPHSRGSVVGLSFLAGTLKQLLYMVPGRHLMQSGPQLMLPTTTFLTELKFKRGN